MTVLIVAGGHYNDRPSGSAKIAFDEAVGLERRKEDVWVLAQGAPGLPEHELSDGIHLLRYLPAQTASWNPARAFTHQKAAADLLARHLPHVDAVHGHTPLATLAALKLYGNSVHCCYTIHSPARMEMNIVWSNSGSLRRITAPLGLVLINRIEAECLRRSQVITALSQYTIDCIGQIHGRKLAERIQLLPGWVDTARFVPAEDRKSLKKQLGWPENIPILFTLRRLEWRMGIDRLINASHSLLQEGLRFHLIIGGTGSLRDRLKEQVRTLGLGNSVTFLGKVEDHELSLAYAACDAFVLPTAELECFGLIALEALSAGRPVLATRAGAIPELIQKFDPLWLARSSETKDIANLIREFLADRLPTHPPAELHEKVYREYNSAKMVGEFIEATLGRYLNCRATN
jgi:glycosyltransferase involved in cell wall biosynthesis